MSTDFIIAIINASSIVPQSEKIGIFSAFAGGFTAFFSIWFFCILQFSPFYFAYVWGLALKEGKDNILATLKYIALPSALALLGFTIAFVTLGASAYNISAFLITHLGLIRQFAGVEVGLMGLLIIGLLKMPDGANLAGLPINYNIPYKIGGFLLGISFATIYMPCITPTLAIILTYTGNASTVEEGTLLLVFYSIGLSTALFIVGMLFAAILTYVKWISNNKKIFIIAFGVLLIIMGIMAYTDLMIYYKGFILRRFTPA
jgi:cytochrome c-type biogenesis protein